MPQMPGGMDMSAVMSMMGGAQGGQTNGDMSAMVKQMQNMGVTPQSGSKTQQMQNMPANVEMPAGMDMNSISKMIPAGALPAGMDLNSLASMSPEQLKKMGVPEDQIANITKVGQAQNANVSGTGLQPKDLNNANNTTYANGVPKTQIYRQQRYDEYLKNPNNI